MNMGRNGINLTFLKHLPGNHPYPPTSVPGHSVGYGNPTLQQGRIPFLPEMSDMEIRSTNIVRNNEIILKT